MLPRYTPNTPGVLIFDNDDTLVQTSKHVEKALQKWMAETLGISPDEAFRELDEGYRVHGDSYAHLARRYGKPASWADEASQAVHQMLADEMETFVRRDAKLQQQLGALQAQGHIIGMLTQARRVYAHKAIAVLDILPFLHPHLVMAFECSEGHFKRRPEPYRLMLKRSLAIAPDRWHLMVEDSPGNLPAAAQTGFTTTAVGPRRNAPGSFIHARYETVYDLNDALLTGTFAPQYEYA